MNNRTNLAQPSARPLRGRRVGGLLLAPLLGLGAVVLLAAAPPEVPLPPMLADSDWSGTPQEAFRNSDIVAKYQCTTCHTVAGGGGTVGPILNRVGSRRTEEWLRRWLADPQQVKPGTKMPKFPFTPDEYERVVGYLSKMKTAVNADTILGRTDLDPVGKGAELFSQLDCYACHRIGDRGRFIGPDLTWLGVRKTRDWERVWLHDPPGWKPTTFMPDFHLSDAEVDLLTAFLEQLRGQFNEAGQMWEFQAAFFLGGSPEKLGEQVYNRFACWACHGRPGAGGERNPNAAPDERVPSLDEVTLSYDVEQLRERLSQVWRPAKKDPAGEEPPFYCPDYGNHMSERELANLYAYLESLVPEGAKWEFR